MRYFFIVLGVVTSFIAGSARAQVTESVTHLSDAELMERVGYGFLLTEELSV